MKRATINIPITYTTIVSYTMMIFSVCVFVANIKVMSPNIKKIPQIEEQLTKQGLAISLIVNNMGLQEQYKYLLAENRDTTQVPRTEIVEKQYTKR